MAFRSGLGAALLCLSSACAGPHSDRDALRRIVQEQCAPHWLAEHRPAPCERVRLPAMPFGREGYAVLADRKGGAHFLLIPTATLTGVESPALRARGAPNFFADAWDARDLIALRVGHDVARDAIGLAVNPRHARSQDQFHIHIECLRPDVAADLRRASARVGAAWAPLELRGRRYLAMRVMGEDLAGANPITLLAEQRPDAAQDLGDYTFIVAGMRFGAEPGFVLLADNGPAGELLLDSTCAASALK